MSKYYSDEHYLEALKIVRQEDETENSGVPLHAQKQISGSGSRWSAALEWLQALVCSVVIVALCFTFGVRIVGVEGVSMEPTLRQNDKLLVVSSLWTQPKDGDVVVVRKNSFMEEPIVKRVIATEGQTVDIDFSNGTVSVDGIVLEEPYIKEMTLTAGDLQFPFTVSPNCVFLMGDNRNESTDSRWSWLGEVDRRYILGKAVWLLLPGGAEWSRIGEVM